MKLDDNALAFQLLAGEIDGGTVETTNGAALIANNSGGTLDGVTLDGTLDMTGNYPTLDVTGGLTLDHGTIDIGTPVAGGTSGALIFQGAQTLGGSGSVVFGASGNRIDTESSGGDSGTLTIGPNVTVGGDYGYIGYNDNNSEIETPIVIQGTVDADTSGGNIQVYGTNSTNSGTIEATNGGTAYLEGTWTDDGVISADSSSTVYVQGSFSVDSGTIEATGGGIAYLTGTWTDDGLISVDSASTIDLAGTFSVSPGASFAGTGTINLEGALDNAGGTLKLDDNALAFQLLAGEIDGGTVETTNGAALIANNSGGTLDGVTLDGTLDMTGNYPTLDVTGGLTLDNGTIDIGTLVDSNTNGTLIFQGAQTLGGSGSIIFGGNGGNGIDTESSGGDSGTLTIAPNVTVGGDYGYIGYNDNNAEIETPVVIQGTVDADTSGGAINIYGTNWSAQHTRSHRRHHEAPTGRAARLPNLLRHLDRQRRHLSRFQLYRRPPGNLLRRRERLVRRLRRHSIEWHPRQFRRDIDSERFRTESRAGQRRDRRRHRRHDQWSFALRRRECHSRRRCRA